MKKRIEFERVTVILTILFIVFFVLWTIVGVLIFNTIKAEAKEKTIEYVPYFIEVEPIPQDIELEIIEPVVEASLLIEVTDEEIELMKRVVMSEASICDVDTKFAVAATIVNRVLSDNFPNTVTEVVFQPNAYSTADNGEPDAECEMVVEWALKYQPFPTNMVYFRTDHYHDFGYELFALNNMYFSGEY